MLRDIRPMHDREHIVRALKAARLERGLNQRELSAKAGIPQAQISKIENGKTDLMLSSLIELARSLDLEVVVVPRKFLSAVRTILRSGEGEHDSVDAHGIRLAGKEIKRIEKAAKRLRSAFPENQDLIQIHRTIADLASLRLGSSSLASLRDVVGTIRAVEQQPARLPELGSAARLLRQTRNELVHRATIAPTQAAPPAYTLDDGDDDA
jgi:transcriptional regulator with XRE-family HTH domain